MQNEIKELGHKSTVAFFGQIIGQALSYILVVLTGRLLGASVYGDVIYVSTFLSFFAIISKMGMENTIIYYLSNQKIKTGDKYYVVSFALKVATIIGGFFVVCGFQFTHFLSEVILHDRNYQTILNLLLPTIILDSWSDLLVSILRGKKRIQLMILIQNIMLPSLKIIGLLFFCGVFGTSNFIAIIFPQYFASLIGLVYGAGKIKREVKKEEKIEISSIQILKYSAPLVLMGAVTIINSNVDKYMIGYLMNSAFVAIYAVAVYISKFSSFALIAINSIFAPMISELFFGGKKDELKYMYQKTTKWVVIINLAIFAMVTVYAKDIMRLAGEDFAIGGGTLIILTLGQIVNSGVGAVGYLNMMTGFPKANLFSAMTAVCVNIIMNLILIRPYGMVGAAFASATSVALGNLINFGYVYKKLRLCPYNMEYIGVMLSFMIASFVVFVFSKIVNLFYIIELIMAGIMFLCIYIFLIIKLSLDRNEKEYLTQVVKKIKIKL